MTIGLSIWSNQPFELWPNTFSDTDFRIGRSIWIYPNKFLEIQSKETRYLYLFVSRKKTRHFRFFIHEFGNRQGHTRKYVDVFLLSLPLFILKFNIWLAVTIQFNSISVWFVQIQCSMPSKPSAISGYWPFIVSLLYATVREIRFAISVNK